MQATSRSDTVGRVGAGAWARFEELAVGHRFETRGRTITEADVVAFGTLTGDLHPAHMDAEWAERGQFRGRIAHGLLALSYSIGLLGMDPEQVVALRRVGSAVFKRPVRLGDTIRARGRIVELRPLTDAVGQVRVDLKIVNQHDRTAILAELDVLWRRSAGDGGPAAAEHDGEGMLLPL